MSEPRHDQLDQVRFHCRGCGARFSATPGRIADTPEDDVHPWFYFAPCECGREAGQAAWERNLLKAWRNATGPRTPEGLAATSKNLVGHPTPEESLRTRFNAMKHGLDAKVAQYFPARPDKYARCQTCEVDRTWCAQQPACVKQTELFLLHHAAFESRDPRHLTGLYAGLQAAIFSVVDDILRTIAADGSKITSPEYFTDSTGRLVVATYIDPADGKRKIIRKIEAHPLFRPLAELLSRNNLSLSDMGMTAKVIDEDNEAMGRIEAANRGATAMEDFARSQANAIDALRDMVQRANANRERDPVLIEHQSQEG